MIVAKMTIWGVLAGLLLCFARCSGAAGPAVDVLAASTTSDPGPLSRLALATKDAGPAPVVTPEQAALLRTEDVSSSSVTPAAMASKFQYLFSQHNVHRKRHGVAPLAWSDALASSAATYAARCVFQHSTAAERDNAGENLAATTALDEAGALRYAIDGWYGEEVWYNYATGESTNPREAVGHFTQVVWAGSRQLGCGVALCPNGMTGGVNWATGTNVVCRYSPPGNWLGEFTRNVFAPDTNGTSPPPSPPPSSPRPSPPPTPAGASSLASGKSLSSPRCLTSTDRAFRLCVSNAGALTLAYGQTVLWQAPNTRVSTSRPFRLLLRTNGNLSLLDAKGVTLWQSRTGGKGTGPYKLILSDLVSAYATGVLLVLQDAKGTPLWGFSLG